MSATIKTQHGAVITLDVNGHDVIASHNGKVMGVVKASANKELGWHLVTGSIAISIDNQSLAAAKAVMAEAAKMTAEELSKFSESNLGQTIRHYQHVAAVEKMSSRGY